MRSVVALLLTLATLPSASARPDAAQRASQPPAAAPSRRDPAVPFAVGETLSYEVSWSSIIQAGTATVSVKERQASAGSTAYYIVAEGRPIPLVARLYALYYKMETLVDTATLLPNRGQLYAEEGKDRRTSITQFDRRAKRVFFEEQSDTNTKLDYAVPPDTQDGLSALFAIRARTFKAGERLTLPVADSGSLYTVSVTVSGPEPVKSGLGATSAWALKGAIKDADGMVVWDNIAVWISNDARRLPVRMEAELPIGKFVLMLRSAR